MECLCRRQHARWFTGDAAASQCDEVVAAAEVQPHFTATFFPLQVSGAKAQKMLVYSDGDSSPETCPFVLLDEGQAKNSCEQPAVTETRHVVEDGSFNQVDEGLRGGDC